MSSRPHGVAYAVLLLALVPAIGAAQTEQPTHSAESAKLLKSDPLHVFSESVQQLSNAVTKSVVQVLTIGFGLTTDQDKDDTAYLQAQRGIGAGVILTDDGYIVTNAHVIEGARQIRVRLQGLEQQNSGKSLPGHGVLEAKLVGMDRLTDLAVLKIDAKDLPALQWANSDDLKQGQVVFAFGSPMGLENSVSMGVVSATARQIDPERPDIYIQTDAPINPGNSGGPLVDVDGHVVGINTFILSESGGNEGLGFAIPSDVVRSVYEQIRKNGHVHRGEIGVYLHTITPELAEGLHLPVEEGVILEDVVPDSSASKAGLKVGDIVTTVGGKPVDDLRQFALDLYSYKVGENIDVGVLRDGKVQNVPVKVTEKSDDPERFADMVTGPDNLVNRLGILGLTINDSLRDMIGSDLRNSTGVLVAARTPTSTLLGEGPQPGDVIHAVNGATVKNIDQLRNHLRGLKPGDPIVLQIERDGLLSYLVLESE
ncbi:MAG TPA: trypsin-like peptidase domain-containing protein [Verrucomicrobiae bacterium]|jgi:serine protease Do|nr:trypsin-like peptidase domain-containing protein [Verrucomicrobiae bacterium]